MLVSYASEVAVLFSCTEQVLTAVNLFGYITHSWGSCKCALNPVKLGILPSLNTTGKKLLGNFFILGYLCIFKNLFLGWNFNTIIKCHYGIKWSKRWETDFQSWEKKNGIVCSANGIVLPGKTGVNWHDECKQAQKYGLYFLYFWSLLITADSLLW